MADQPQLDPRATKQQLRQLNPEFQGTDDELYQAWIVQNPQYRNLATGKDIDAGRTLEDPSWFTQAITTGARIIPSIAGGMLGVPGGIPGIVAGGAIGSAAGETLAQGIEQFLGQRESFNPWSVGVAGAIGAVPGAGKLPTGLGRQALTTALRQRVGREAFKGGALGMSGDIGFQLAETGEVDPMRTFLAGGLGAGMGGGLTALSQRGLVRKAPTVGIERLDKLDKDVEQLLFQQLRNPKSTLQDAKKLLTTLYVDQEANYKTFIEELATTHKLKLGYEGRKASPVVAADLAGGVGRKVEWSVDQMRDIFHRVWQKDMSVDVDRLLTMKGFRRASEDWEAKIKEKMLQGKPDEALALSKKMEKGEYLPQGYTPATIKADYEKLQQGLMAAGRWEEVSAFADEVITFNKESLDMMVRYELISKKMHEELSKVGKHLTRTQIKDLGVEEGMFGMFKGRKDPQGYALREHVPLLRFLDAMGDDASESVGRHITGKKGAWKLDPMKGSKRATLPPMESSIKARRGIQIAGEDNARKLAILKFRELDPKFKEIFRPIKDLKTLKEGEEIFTVIQNGEKQAFTAPAPVAAAIQHLDEAGVATLGEVGLSFFSRLTARFATSLNVGFSVTNVLRDNADLLMMRKIVHNPIQLGGYVVEWGRTLGQVLRQESTHGARALARATPFGLGRKFGKLAIPAIKQEVLDPSTGRYKLTDIQKEFVEAGGGFSGQTRQAAPGQFVGSVAEEGGGPISNTLIGGIDAVLSPFARFSGALEDTTKLAAYKTLRKQGINPQEAAWLTRKFGGSPDFAVRGRYARQSGSLILFFNAQMQGIVRNAATLKDLAKDPKAFGMMMTAATGFELLRTQWNDRFTDPDGTRTADRITTSDRENYWTWVLPETEMINGVARHKTVKFSKGHLARVLFNPVADMLHAAASEREVFSPTQTTLNLLEQFSPGSLNLEPGRLGGSFLDGVVSSATPLIKTPAELLWNRSTFSKMQLESMGQRQRSPSYRATDRTSPLFKQAARRLSETTGLEVSPILSEYAMRSIIPGLGEQVTKAGDVLLEGGSFPAAAGQALIDPVVRRFKGSEGDQVIRDLTSKFYRAVAQTRTAQADLRSLQVNEPGKAQAFVNKNQHLLQNRLSLQRIQTQLGRLQQLPEEQGAPGVRQLLEHASAIIDRMKKNDG